MKTKTISFKLNPEDPRDKIILNGLLLRGFERDKTKALKEAIEAGVIERQRQYKAVADITKVIEEYKLTPDMVFPGLDEVRRAHTYRVLCDLTDKIRSKKEYRATFIDGKKGKVRELRAYIKEYTEKYKPTEKEE
ncbi:MAG: hypothetical protein IMZ64_13000 [Bacteroidetes bacterium]|nr:hypothetical protein [Bacteroidota bacterium]